MPYHCPSCKAEIPGGLSQEEHVERLAAKNEENKQLKAQLTAAQQAAKEASELKAERDRLTAEISKRDRAAERAAAFDAAGIPNTPAIRKGFELVYDSEMSGIEKPAAFNDWLGNDETQKHPLLSVHYAKPQQAASGQQSQSQGQQAGTAAQGASGQQSQGQSQSQSQGQGQSQSQGQQGGTAQQAARLQGGLTNVDRGASTASNTDTGPRTSDEVQKYFRSPEYRALPLDKQRERKAQLLAQLQDHSRSG